MAIAPSKGGSSIAQAFLQNTATQPSPLPTIRQPEARPLPTIPNAPSPVMGSMAPAPEKPNYLHALGFGGEMLGKMAGLDAPPTPVRIHGMDGEWIRQRTPDGYDWKRADGSYEPVKFGTSYARPRNDREAAAFNRLAWLLGEDSGEENPQPVQAAPQPSQAQLLARAINERARKRG